MQEALDVTSTEVVIVGEGAKRYNERAIQRQKIAAMEAIARRSL